MEARGPLVLAHPESIKRQGLIAFFMGVDWNSKKENGGQPSKNTPLLGAIFVVVFIMMMAVLADLYYTWNIYCGQAPGRC